MKKSFASDNNAGIHPDILAAIIKANDYDYVSYGDDYHTQEAVSLFKEIFGDDTEVFFVLNGTGANATALKAMVQSFEAIVCPETAHIAVDECGAVENLTGAKLIPVSTPEGKINIQQVQSFMHFVGDQHHSQPKVISISQSTEMGTLYSPDEIRNIADFAHENDMYLHMDGARIANACAALNIGLRELTKDLGVDVLSFGSTKNGMGFVFREKRHIRNFQENGKLCFDIMLPTQKKSIIGAIVRNISFLENGVIKVGCEINNMDDTSRANYDEFVS